MSGTEVRTAVVLYMNGDMNEAEAARCTGLSRAQLRQYIRTCGSVVQTPSDAADVECADPP